MENQYRDYRFTDKVVFVNKKRGLMTELQTKEFGLIKSLVVLREYIDDKSDQMLWDELAQDVIEEYEDRLKYYDPNKAQKKSPGN